MGWYSYFLFGNLVADAAIGLFAYKTSIFDRDLGKLITRVEYLKMLCDQLKSTECDMGDGSKEVIHKDPLTLGDEFLSNFKLNVSENDKNVLGISNYSLPTAFNKLPKDQMEHDKLAVHANKKQFPYLIKKAENDMFAKKNGYLNKYILEKVIYFFAVGVAVQIVSWLYGVLDP